MLNKFTLHGINDDGVKCMWETHDMKNWMHTFLFNFQIIHSVKNLHHDH